jgi:arginine decarboxylase
MTSHTSQDRDSGIAQRRPASQAASPGAADDGWTVADAASLYGIDTWGHGFFGVNEAGHVAVHPQGPQGPQLDLKVLVDQLRQRDLEPPLLIRFSDVLKQRLSELRQAFDHAIAEMDYRGGYKCVYPIKVNQQRHVVEEMLSFGAPHGFGLEAGSKPELLAVLALVDDPRTPIICNGFKDDQFIEAVILATKLGRNVIPVVERYSELDLLIKYARQYQVQPRLGLRVKLASRGAGRWEHSSSQHAKFGLFTSEVLEAVETLRRHDMLDALKLLHFHLGSQVNHISAVKAAINEQIRIYVELHQAGAGLEYIDVGGGLGVDYEGGKTNAGSSINYTLQEYANDVVFHIREVCEQTGTPHPTILSESGRALAAYHSVLVFGVLGTAGFDRFEPPRSDAAEADGELPRPVQTLRDAYDTLGESNFIECYHDAQLARDEVLHLFNLGYCSLTHRSLAERLFFAICARVARLTRDLDYVPEEFRGLDALLSDTYFCNCSIFQSLPDVWAIDQIFPIMPIHRLDEKPTARGSLADITCDSDGAIRHFLAPDQGQNKSVLELHPYEGEDYFLGAFLVGAYQEILGDLHNLFGDTNAVHVSLDEAGEVSVDEIVEGDSVSTVLKYVQFQPDDLRRQFRKSVERAVREGKLTIDESRLLRRFYEQGLNGYTYLT